MDKCPICGNEMHNVYFGEDGRYKDIQFKRCMNCNHIEQEKKEKQE